MHMVQNQVPTFGNIFVVMNSSNSDEGNYQKMQELIVKDTDGLVRFYTSLELAYAATESNNNDVILLDANSSHTVADMLTVSNSRVHFIGMDGGGRLTAQGAKIQPSAVGTDMAATIKVTGTRCSFRNLKIINSGTHANSIASMIDQGEGTLIENCSIMKLSDLGEAAVADFVCRSDSATYINVEFGFDTLVQTAARATFLIKADGAKRAKHLRVENCHFTCSSSEATKSFILVSSTASLAFSNIFKDCSFSNALVSSASAAALDDAVTSVSSLVEGNLLFINPASDTTEFCSAVTDQVKVVGPAVSAQTGEGVTPS